MQTLAVSLWREMNNEAEKFGQNKPGLLSLSDGHCVTIKLVRSFNQAEVLDFTVNKVKRLWLWPAVKFGLDPLWVSVWGKLLCGFVCQEEQRVVLRIRNFKLFRAYLAHVFRCGIRLHLKGFGCAAITCILQCHPQIVLNRDKKKSESIPKYTKRYLSTSLQ